MTKGKILDENDKYFYCRKNLDRTSITSQLDTKKINDNFNLFDILPEN